MNKKATDIESQLVRGEKLSKHSYISIGGEADYYFEPSDLESLLGVLEYCIHKSLSFRVIGSGGNILFSDKGFRGCIISMASFEKEYFKVDGDEVEVSSGVRTTSFVRKCAEHSLSGMEFLSFIPGTIGGTLAMNAGCINYFTNQYDDISKYLVSAVVLQEGKLHTLGANEVEFAYRYSSLKSQVILFGTFKLENKKIPNLKKVLRLNYKERAKKIPMEKPTLGSMFKNPPDSEFSAGKLIEEVGLKGYREGGVMISKQHGNVFENIDNGTSRDVLNLIDKVQQQVRNKFGIEMELEIDYIE